MIKERIVIKYGGSIMADEVAKKAFFQAISNLHTEGKQIIIVHGGGNAISQQLEKEGVASTFIEGRRVTDTHALNAAQMVLSGQIGKDIAHALSKQGVLALAIDGRDGNSIHAEKKLLTMNQKEVDLGFVGVVRTMNHTFFEHILNANMIPIVAPIATYKDSVLNINADEMAQALAIELQAKQLIFLTDVPGVYLDINDKTSIQHTLTIVEAEELIDSHIIVGGMIPKVEACIDCLNKGVKQVKIIDGESAQVLDQIILNQLQRGTTFLQ